MIKEVCHELLHCCRSVQTLRLTGAPVSTSVSDMAVMGPKVMEIGGLFFVLGL